MDIGQWLRWESGRRGGNEESGRNDGEGTEATMEVGLTRKAEKKDGGGAVATMEIGPTWRERGKRKE